MQYNYGLCILEPMLAVRLPCLRRSGTRIEKRPNTHQVGVEWKKESRFLILSSQHLGSCQLDLPRNHYKIYTDCALRLKQQRVVCTMSRMPCACSTFWRNCRSRYCRFGCLLSKICIGVAGFGYRCTLVPHAVKMHRNIWLMLFFAVAQARLRLENCLRGFS